MSLCSIRSWPAAAYLLTSEGSTSSEYLAQIGHW